MFRTRTSGHGAGRLQVKARPSWYTFDDGPSKRKTLLVTRGRSSESLQLEGVTEGLPYCCSHEASRCYDGTHTCPFLCSYLSRTGRVISWGESVFVQAYYCCVCPMLGSFLEPTVVQGARERVKVLVDGLFTKQP